MSHYRILRRELGDRSAEWIVQRRWLWWWITVRGAWAGIWECAAVFSTEEEARKFMALQIKVDQRGIVLRESVVAEETP